MSSEMAYLYRSTYGFEPLYGALDWDPPKTKRVAQSQREDFKKISSKSVERVRHNF